MSHYRCAWVSLCALAGVVAVPASPAKAQELIEHTTSFAGQTRRYLVYVPEGYRADVASPLVLAMHQFASNGDVFAVASGWMSVADRVGCLVAFPTGGIVATPPLQWIWNVWRFDDANPADGAFLVELVDEIESNYAVDRSRVYATGFSNGGMMTATLACRFAETFAAVAPVASGWITAYNPPESQCQPSVPIPVWQWRGVNENGLVSGVPPHALPRSVQDAQQRAFWIVACNAQTPPESFTYIYEGSGATLTLETSVYHAVAEDPTSVEFRYTQVRHWGHAYFPGAADLIWDEFFSRFTRPLPCEAPAGGGELRLSRPAEAVVRLAAEGADPALAFEWTRDGVVLIDGPTVWGSLVSGSATGVLRIESFAKGDEGVYVCRCANECGEALWNGLGVRAEDCVGDLTGDGRLDAEDAAELIERLLGSEQPGKGRGPLRTPSVGEFVAAWASGGC